MRDRVRDVGVVCSKGCTRCVPPRLLLYSVVARSLLHCASLPHLCRVEESVKMVRVYVSVLWCYGLVSRARDSGFRIQGSGCRVQGAGFRVHGSGFRVQGSGFRVQGSGV